MPAPPSAPHRPEPTAAVATAFAEGFARLRRAERALTGAAQDLVEAYQAFDRAAEAAGIRPDGLPRAADLLKIVADAEQAAGATIPEAAGPVLRMVRSPRSRGGGSGS